ISLLLTGRAWLSFVGAQGACVGISRVREASRTGFRAAGCVRVDGVCALVEDQIVAAMALTCGRDMGTGSGALSYRRNGQLVPVRGITTGYGIPGASGWPAARLDSSEV